MKHTLSVPSAVIALLLAGDATAYHLGGSKPRAMRNGRRQFGEPDESVSPDISTVSDSPSFTNTNDVPNATGTETATLTATLSFTPSNGLPTSGGPLFPTGFNSTFYPGPFPTATGLPIPEGDDGSGGGGDDGDPEGPTTSVDCSAMASSIFGSIFPYPTGTGGATGFPGWPFPTGGPTGRPTVSLSFPPGPAPTGPLGPPIIPISGPSVSVTLSIITTTIATGSEEAGPTSDSALLTESETVEKRYPVAFGRARQHAGPIPAGVFPPGHAYPTGGGIFPTPTEEQKAQISHYFEVCGWGKGGGKGKGKGKGHFWPGEGATEPQPVLEGGGAGGKAGCDKGDE